GGPYDGTYEQDWEFVKEHGDLDECNGRQGVTLEFPGGTYYYVITDDYPSIPTCFWGDVVDSFVRDVPGSTGPQEEAPGIAPPKPIDELVPPPGFDI
ncbi:MAG: YHYH protein, partial [Candidatus Saccharimonadales bacterium]|nr:YHYH protein [Candidatus Saccharimonadales bacterium]